jgi:hypothetical protein
MLHPSEVPIKFQDYGNTSKHSWHENHTMNNVFPSVEPSKEWLIEVKHSSEVIQILSPSTTMPCSLRGTILEALHNPTVGTSIMSEFLAKNHLGNMLLVLTNKLLKSPLELFFECCGIARAVPMKINETEVCLDFHIFAILEFDLLIGHPLENLIQEKTSYEGLDKKLGTTASATPIPCLEIPMAKHNPNHNPV